MLTTHRIADMVKTLDEGFGAVVIVMTLDEKCAYSRTLDKAETDDLVAALASWGQGCQGCETAKASIEKLAEERDALKARVKVLEGDAVPFRWALVTPGDTVHSYYLGKAEAEVASMGTVDIVTPLYRHPPKTGEPVAWRWIANGETVLRFLPADPNWPGVEAVTPLYEAPPPAAVDVAAAIRKALAQIEQFDGDDIALALAHIRAAIGEKGG